MMDACSDLIEEYGVRINILGDLSLLPPDVRDIMDRVMRMTASHTEATLNICFPYTARDEIRQAIAQTAESVEQGKVDIRDVDRHVLSAHMLTAGSPPLDLLVRTSGEARLSDFLLWQVSETACPIYFGDTMWPDLGIAQLLPILLAYQTR
jgi:ditrans,polycis-polyprenyl diphosphate synthase